MRFWQSTFLFQWTVEEESRLTFGASNSQIGAPLFLPKCKTAHILQTSCCIWARTRAQALLKSTLCPKQLGRILAVANARNKGRNAEANGMRRAKPGKAAAPKGQSGRLCKFRARLKRHETVAYTPWWVKGASSQVQRNVLFSFTIFCLFWKSKSKQVA